MTRGCRLLNSYFPLVAPTSLGLWSIFVFLVGKENREQRSGWEIWVFFPCSRSGTFSHMTLVRIQSHGPNSHKEGWEMCSVYAGGKVNTCKHTHSSHLCLWKWVRVLGPRMGRSLKKNRKLRRERNDERVADTQRWRGNISSRRTKAKASV